MSIDDIVRGVALLCAFLVAGATATVGVAHYRMWRRTRQSGRPHAGLLPLHVALISASYLLLTLFLAQAIVDGFGQPMSSRIYGYTAAWALGLAALIVVGRLQGRRQCSALPSRPVDGASGRPADTG